MNVAGGEPYDGIARARNRLVVIADLCILIPPEIMPNVNAYNPRGGGARACRATRTVCGS